MSHSAIKEGFELSVNQKELWRSVGDKEEYYNLFDIAIRGYLDINKLTLSIKNIIGRHEALRSGLMEQAGSSFPYQVIEEENADTTFGFYLEKIGEEDHILHVRLYALWGDSFSCHLFYQELCNEYA